MALKIYHYPVVRESNQLRFSTRYGRERTLSRFKKYSTEAPKTFTERLSRANTPVFRTIGFFAACLLGFLMLDAAFGTNIIAQASAPNGSIVSSFLEVTPFKRAPVVAAKVAVAPEPEQKPIVDVQKYVVKSGDTLTDICEKLKQNCADLKLQNGLQVPYTLTLGQEITYLKK